MKDAVRSLTITVTWSQGKERDEHERRIGVVSRTGYRYNQQIQMDTGPLILHLPVVLAGQSVTCWARKDRDDHGAAVLELNLRDGEQTTGELGEDEKIEWRCHWHGSRSTGTDRTAGDHGKPTITPEVAKYCEHWEQIRELGRREHQGRLFRGEAEEYAGPIRSGMVREWGLSGQPLQGHEETLLREASEYANYEDRDQLIAECQHTGIRMNVIDFTTCAKVALWFACAPTGGNGRIRVVERKQVRGRIIEPVQRHPRIKAQRGVLVYEETGVMEEEEVSETIVIRKEDKSGILDILRSDYGIEGRNLFPDLERFRQDIESRRIRFVRAELAAGAQACQRGDYERARRFLEACCASWQARYPDSDGGFFNIVPLRNLALTLAALGRRAEAISTGKRALEIARREAREQDGGRILRQTEEALETIKRASAVEFTLLRFAEWIRREGPRL